MDDRPSPGRGEWPVGLHPDCSGGKRAVELVEGTVLRRRSGMQQLAACRAALSSNEEDGRAGQEGQHGKEERVPGDELHRAEVEI